MKPIILDRRDFGNCYCIGGSLMSIQQTVTRIVRESAGDSYNWKPGDRVEHPEHGLVEITGGSYLRNGRVSNFFHWKKVKKDGSLQKTEHHGYGWS